MKNFNVEMIEKAKAAKSPEELLELAKASNVEMTADEAATYFAQLNPMSGELSDDDLNKVFESFKNVADKDYTTNIDPNKKIYQQNIKSKTAMGM